MLPSRVCKSAYTYPLPNCVSPFQIVSRINQNTTNIPPLASLALSHTYTSSLLRVSLLTAFPKMVVVEAMGFMAKDYRKRFQAALALLTEMYVADVAAAAAAAAAAQAAKQEKGKSIKRAAKLLKPRGFDLYDETLLSLLTTLSGSLEPTWRQKLFTQTLLECPRVPPAALELVCTLCDLAAQPHDVQTGECVGCLSYGVAQSSYVGARGVICFCFHGTIVVAVYDWRHSFSPKTVRNSVGHTAHSIPKELCIRATCATAPSILAICRCLLCTLPLYK